MPTLFRRTKRGVVEHVKSPVTVRAILLFLMIGFFAYTIIDYAQERQSAADRAERFDTLVSKWTESMAAAQRNAVEIDLLKRTTATELDILTVMSKNMADIAETLRAERDILTKEHGAILNAVKRPAPSRSTKSRSTKRPAQPPCWRIETRTEKFGDQVVVKRDLIRTKCPK